jgi:hypothetical protein
MLISRVFDIENENVNLKEDAMETVPAQSACLRASFIVIGQYIQLLLSSKSPNFQFQILNFWSQVRGVFYIITILLKSLSLREIESP